MDFDDQVDDDDDDDGEGWVCADCVGEPYLRARIQNAGLVRRCQFCGSMGPAITVGELADAVEAAFEGHYQRTSNEPDGFEYSMMRDPESSYEFERGGEEVLWAIAGAAEVSEDIAEAVLELLGDRHGDFEADAMGEETEFGPESYYERRGPNDVEFQLGWRSLEQSLKFETRYFNKEAGFLLERIFSGIESFRSEDGRDVIQPAGPGTDLTGFHRARVFHSDDALGRALEYPNLELGPPPGGVAIAGRMNARGVALFYGATDAGAALAEVRPPVGSRALVGRFEIVRPLRLLDIDALRSVYVEGSIFDGGYMGRLELAKFLASLARRMTMPVMPDDEPSEYLITQVIADYLASNDDLGIDGLLYPSVQQPGEHRNVVLFRKASLVGPLDLPPGTNMSANLADEDEEGRSPNYWVFVQVPAPRPVPAPPSPPFWPISMPQPVPQPPVDRQVTLRIELDTVKVHHVNSVTIATEAHDVPRFVRQRSENLSVEL